MYKVQTNETGNMADGRCVCTRLQQGVHRKPWLLLPVVRRCRRRRKRRRHIGLTRAIRRRFSPTTTSSLYHHNIILYSVNSITLNKVL